MVESEKLLKEIYKKYIDRPIYRVVPYRDYKKILKEGINPKKDPYEKIKPKLKQFFKIILKLEKKGKIIKLKWGSKEIFGSYAVKTTIDDLLRPYVDFTPNNESYYMKMHGGATVTNIKRLIKKLIEIKPKLSNKDLKIVDGLNKWTKKKTCKNKVIYVQGSSKIFETALFQELKSTKTKSISGRKKRYYLPNPFGSFEHFKKIIKKNGLKKYLSHFKNNNFYLRVKDKIPANEILSF